ncbi:LPS assembly lipoprotein LptE [Lacibacterium aquatile]|uniref:LPS assembly lipoprotein LptE n=1 Tax=Lacibacterium aquatile TaxID=1168082 RepID=A0ABW5DWQ4_9PROT
MWSAKPLVALVAAAFLASCGPGGFQPLHGDRKGQVADTSLAAIQITPIPDRTGQLLRNYLTDRFAAGSAAARWRLDVKVVESGTSVGLQRDATTTYGRLALTADYTLTEIQSGRQLVKDQTRSLMGYVLLEGGFPSITAQNDARERAIREVGDQLATRLMARLAEGVPAPQAPKP